MAFENYSAARNMTPEEVLAVFRELQRINPWNDQEDLIEFEMSVHEWQWNFYDVADWNECRRAWKSVNGIFNTTIPYDRWKATVKPMKRRTVGEMCELIAFEAVVEEVRPVSVFGKPCQTAGAFLAVRNTLARIGIDVDNLRPSSLLEPLLRKHEITFVLEMMKLAPGKVPRVETKEHRMPEAATSVMVLGLLLMAGSLPLALLSIYFYSLAVLITPLVVLGMPFALGGAFFAFATRSLQPRSVKVGDLRTIRDLCEALVSDKPLPT